MQENRNQSHYVIDFQGFKAKGGFCIQEFAAFDLANQNITHLFFNHDLLLNEFDFSSYCCSKSLHKICKSYGSYHPSKLLEFFSSNLESTFYVLGLDQCTILSNFCNNKIVNLNSISTSFSVLNKFHLKCTHPAHNSHVNFLFCSLKRAHSFGNQFLDMISL
jgi:hypothetical protein